MAVQFVEAPQIAQQRSSSLPQTLADQCETLGMPASGNAAGHASTTDLSGLPLGPYQQKVGWQPRGIGAMAGSVLTALLGMSVVVWYAMGGEVTEEEIEEQVHAKKEKKQRRKDFLKSLIKKKKT